MAQSKTPQVDYDGLFKAFVFRRFRDFLSFAIPVLHDQVNWQHDPQFLEQELIDEVRSNHKRKSKRLHTDHLVKVQLYNGEARLVYVHIEFQHKPETDFGLRMFNYMMRIRMKHNTRQVTAVAVFSGAPPPASALMYQEEVMGTFTSYRFNSIIAAHQDEAALMASQNTFAILVLAAKYVYEVKKDEGRLFALKRKLMELSLKLNLDRGSTIEILIFVKDLMVLSEENEQLLEKEINHLMGTTKIRRPIPFTERTWRFLDNLYAELNGGKSPEELIAEAKKQAEEEAADRIAEERRRAEEAAADRIAEERRRAEEAAADRIAEERRRAEEAAADRIAEERRRAEEAAADRIAEERRRAEEAAADRIAEERRRAEEAAADRIAEERRRAEETVRQLEGERRHAEEERRRLEEAVVRLYSQFAMPAEQVAVAMNLTPIAVEEILHRYGHK